VEKASKTLAAAKVGRVQRKNHGPKVLNPGRKLDRQIFAVLGQYLSPSGAVNEFKDTKFLAGPLIACKVFTVVVFSVFFDWKQACAIVTPIYWKFICPSVRP
jgi:hypothetical protein